jgi:RNA polymerase sigma factor (sigma-70 family)
MHDSSDMDLLREYARQNSEAAFAELVRRHIALVYSAALRHVGSAGHAEEITQAVFIILARKAAGLRPDTILPGWLCETTRLTALSFLRGERRRQFREQEAYMQSTLQESNETAAWQQLAPLLDEALARLGKKERDAVVLRFFKDQNLREVAAALNINEPAAQRRVHRAVEKLRQFFMKRGLALSSGTITGAISAHSVQAAPAGLAVKISVIAIAKGAAAGTTTLTLVKGALKIMAWTKAKTAIVTGVAVLLAAGMTPILIKEIRKSSSALRTTQATEIVKGQLFGLAQLVDAGNTTPEAAWESRYWARAKGDYDAVIAATDPHGVNVAKDWMGDKATFRARSQKEFLTSFKEFQILARKDLASDRVELKYQFTFLQNSPPQATKIAQMLKVDGVWRVCQTRDYDASWDDGSQPEPQP